MISEQIKTTPEKCVGCRICKLTCSFTYHKTVNPNKARRKIIDLYDLTPKIEFTEECIQCGKCASTCLYGALELIEVNSF